MVIPVLSRINGFEAEITRLQNPAFVFRAFNLAKAHEVSRIYTFWTLGALILAFFATFTSLIHRTKLVIFRFRRGRTVLTEPLLVDDDEDDSCSVSSCSSDEEDKMFPVDDDSKVAGIYVENEGQYGKLMELRRRLSWSDFTKGKNVVKSWDTFGSDAESLSSSRGLISLWESHKTVTRSPTERCTSGPIWFLPNYQNTAVVSMPSPTVIITARIENCRNAVLRVWDTRVGCHFPEILTEWHPSYMGINSSEITEVRDIRKVGLTIDNPTESDIKTWWDSDAVILENSYEDDRFHGSTLSNGCDSVVSRCRNAMFSYLF